MYDINLASGTDVLLLLQLATNCTVLVENREKNMDFTYAGSEGSSQRKISKSRSNISAYVWVGGTEEMILGRIIL